MNRARTRSAPVAWALALAFLVAGCGTGSGLRLFVNTEADMSFYTKVAVVPFANLSSERFAGERVGRAFYTELVIAERFQLVEDGEFRRALERAGATQDGQGQYDPEKIKLAASTLGANGLIRGTVTDYQMQRVGSSDSPVVSFDVEMLDLATGGTVWRGSITRRGKGRVPVVGGASTQTFGRLVQESCKEMVGKLDKEAF